MCTVNRIATAGSKHLWERNFAVFGLGCSYCLNNVTQICNQNG